MIIKKIRRRAPGREPHEAEFAYLIHLSRYVGRADVADLHELVRLSDDVYLQDLARYAIAEGRETPVLAAGGRNLHGTSLSEWQAELAALLHRCPDSAGAIDHWVFSWPEGEKPTVEEVERVIAIFMRSQGLERCKGVWGYHDDTDNAHVHLASVRIDPVTAARVTAGDGWEIDTAHRAKAVIEAEFPHWVPETGSRYAVRSDRLIERASGRVIGDAHDPSTWARRRAKTITTASKPKRDHKAVDPDSLAYEEATGFMSRKRVALDIAVPTVLAADTLDAAHAALAEQGIELRRQRSGAAFVIDGKTVKASIDRRTSCEAIEKRFKQSLASSPYRPAAVRPRERWPNDADRRAYYALRRPHDERLSEAAANVRGALGSRSKDEAINAAFEAAIGAAAFPSFAAWRAGAEVPDPAAVVFAALGFSTVSARGHAQIKAAQPLLEGFRATQLKGRVVYRAAGHRAGPPAFIDLGDKVLVHAASNRAAVRASLLLIASRFPDNRIAVTGDRAFQTLVLEIATAQGIVLDGSLGREQAKRGVPPAGAAAGTGHPSRPPATPIRPLPETVQQTPQLNSARHAERVLAMLAHLFHRSDWSIDDHWTRTSLDEVAREVPTAPRSLSEVGLPASEFARAAPPAAIDQARRAVALAAAARSR